MCSLEGRLQLQLQRCLSLAIVVDLFEKFRQFLLVLACVKVINIKLGLAQRYMELGGLVPLPDSALDAGRCRRSACHQYSRNSLSCPTRSLG